MSKVLDQDIYNMLHIMDPTPLDMSPRYENMLPTRPASHRKRKQPKYSDMLLREVANSVARQAKPQVDLDARVLKDKSAYWVQSWTPVDLSDIEEHMDRLINRLAQKGDMRTRSMVQAFGSMTIMPTGLPLAGPAALVAVPGVGTIAANPIPKPSSGSRKSK